MQIQNWMNGKVYLTNHETMSMRRCPICNGNRKTAPFAEENNTIIFLCGLTVHLQYNYESTPIGVLIETLEVCGEEHYVDIGHIFFEQYDW